uniref:Adhesion G-protein coupled receptor V1 n=1 Tax=Danio rerio TaxID=7955 RepID=AGRV1_DANRE|nr:RecName: Full=Adhesion G-protein coupled receptor V1; AltName: Full=G-protein coupled receptor 98; AltName: Full=Monogenic audiogenic seizure susceptibility protein 1 homolog; AltName: Full=Very large G-protein coupled receptor 1; Flags: Precursor [Danio rerio]AAT07468.1 very large G-protein coupled receptor-1 [Danio rerio]
MPAVLALSGLLLMLLTVSVRSESAELRFQGQTQFVVNESSRAIVRLVVERVGDPINVTALVLLQGDDTGDFEATTAAAFLLSSESSKTIFIAVKDDDIPEADETFVFILRLQSSSNGVTVGTPNTATITILSNDNAFGIISFNSSSLITVEESKGRSQYVPLTLLREKGTYGTVTVNFEIFGGPNPASEDLSPDMGNITFPPGRSVVVFSIMIQDDKLPEDDEIFTVQLTEAAGGALLNPNRSSVQIKISRNDAPIRFSKSTLVVPENIGVISLTVTRGRTEDGLLIGSDDKTVSVAYAIITGNGAASATPLTDFVDLQTERMVVFLPGVHEADLRFSIRDDNIPEIAESFQVVLLEETLLGDAVLVTPSLTLVTIEPNDKPYGVLSISPSPIQPHIINEDLNLIYEGMIIVRNGGTHGAVSVQWNITRNSTDRSPVSADLNPAAGTLRFSEGQMSAVLPLNITQDSLPEEAEAFLLKLIPGSVQGGAEVDEPMEMVFFIQDSDDVYGRFGFHPRENQSIQSQPEGRFLSLSFLREGGTLGEVRLTLTALYIPARPLDPSRARDGVLNGTSVNTVLFSSGQSRAQLILPIRNDAFLQNGAHFRIQLDSVELVNITPPIPSMSPRFAGALNISLIITPDIANGEIGFTSNQTVVALEPEDSNSSLITLQLRRDGTDGQAVVFWSLRPTGENKEDVTKGDISPFTGSVTFLSGQSEAVINLTVLADNIPEINETIILTLDRTNVDNQILKPGFTSREIVILENDDPGGVFEFSPVSKGPWFINEGETVELRVIRAQGQLLNQLIRYTVIPSGTAQFYGATGILEFQPGEREVMVALVAKPDGIPELDETFSVVLSSYSTPASRLGNRREVNITVRKSDDPFGVIEFIQPDLDFTINESKALGCLLSILPPLEKSRGRFGNVSIFWILEPTYSGDVKPVQGEIVFAEGEYQKNLTLSSVADEIPEKTENFTITLLNATGGARLGNILSARLSIRANDDPIYFAEPVGQRVREGGVANFTILRAGLANFVTTVNYRFEYGDTSSEDFIPESNDTMLVFHFGEWMKNISVAVVDDNIPETDEPFYIVLFNATGDAVVYGQITATVVIEANDDANGIFSLDSAQKPGEEGKTNNFYVLRDRGHFGNVTIYWQLFANDTPLEPYQEFVNTSGFITFRTGEKTKPIVLEVISDKLPEFNEFYELRLMNVSGGYPGEGGKLANRDLNASVLIPFNDDPFGVFAIAPDSLEREVAEDVLSVNDMTSVTSLTILRQQGTFGDVRVAWEILSGAFPRGLPPMEDLILMASFPSAVELQPHSRRRHAGTDALFFSGRPGAYGSISAETTLLVPQILANFTLSVWLKPKPNTDGFVVSKGNGNGTVYYGVQVQTNDSHVTIMLHYTTIGSNSTHVARATANTFVEDAWVHVIIAVEDGIIEFYLDGSPIPGGIKSLKGEAIVNDATPIRIGSNPDGEQRFTGLLQDVRLYSSCLNRSQIHELHNQPAKTDLHNVSGYLTYRQEEKEKSFLVEVRDDQEAEGEEVFYLQLVAVQGGARLPMPRPTAILKVMKSDNANGLFSFTGACIPDIAEEGSMISCVVERTRGALDYVYVNYTVTQLDSPADLSNASDFANATGFILFQPGQLSEVLNLLVVNDDLPEVDEHFRVRLVSAKSGDGKPGSTPTSGASIDPEKAVNNVTVKASDHPYGLLQFQTTPVPVGMIRPALEEARVTVQEEAGVVRLLVARAQGLLGRVMVGYRTSPFTAAGSEDYEGFLDFLPGERFKYINVTIIDNSVPELDKVFRVELYNPNGGVDPYFASEGSGSGESETDFFLPSFHYHHANLGAAARIIVTIAASDEAHGVFQFGADSLIVNGTEPEEGRSTVVLQVIRTFGALSNVTVYWEADAASEGELVYRSGNVNFEVGQTVRSIYLLISQDDVPELDKTFKVRLTNASHGRLGKETTATLTVLASDDPYGLFVFSDNTRPVRVAEANALVALTIQRRKGLMGRVRVAYRTLRDTDTVLYSTPGVGRASEGNDFIAVVDSVIFSANQSEVNVTLRVLDDNEPERAESVFLELVSVTLIEGLQPRPVALSPRLGPRNVTIAQVIIEASDDAFGVLQLSSSAVSVPEYYTGPIINVTRIGGIFADVSVKFRAVPLTARVGEDYRVASSDVVLLEGESSKPVPILIINDVVPELEETFRIELLNQTTGGALLGDLTQAIITILPSDDPFGLFVFQAAPITIEEPALTAFEVSVPIVRNAGTMGDVAVQWRATVNGRPATGDLRPVSGEVMFSPGETLKTLKVEVLPDDVPEIEEIIKVELVSATSGGNIGLEKVVDTIVPANDNPHGTVYFEQAVYRVQEPLEGIYIANVTIRRSGGNFGMLEVVYSTLEVDIVSNALKEGRNFLVYYDSRLAGVPSNAIRRPINITTSTNVLNFCAAFCLRERACQAFSFTNTTTPSCFWVTSGVSQLSPSPQTFTYLKNTTATASLFSSQAVAGSDFITMTAQTTTMLDGSGVANLTVPILTDSLPEMDESFIIKILKVSLVNVTATARNLPTIRQPDTALVTIGMNGDAFGIFLLYSINPNATQEGLYLEVREEPKTTVLLVIERRGGSMGQVTVEWKYVGGSATPNADFNGTGETLIFAEGDVKKTLEFIITDDTEPENNETLQIGLVSTEGGSRILPSSDTVTILILANDNAAGVVGFHTASRSRIVREGESVTLLVERTAPAIGNVAVDWRIEGPLVPTTFADTSGTLFFSEGILNNTIVLKLLEDTTPEDREEYRVILSNIQTTGVTKTGIAALSAQGREAVVSVEASDEPFGLLSIAPSSLQVTTDEKNTTIRIYINREFGASGAVNISYETVRGSLQDLRQTEGALAQPGQDFRYVSNSVIMQDGQTSVSIPITIIDDDIPELQEFFLVNITSAVLITTLPTAPKLNTEGLVAEIIINANDGIRGIIGWQNIDYVVNETIGVLTLVAYRDAGTYGNVSLFFYAQNLEAQLGLDFNATPSMIYFVDGERHKFIEVQILDDAVPEGGETFQLILANPSAGLQLGENTTATVMILANDDGHGIISFNNSEHFLLREPTSVSGLGTSVATLYIIRDPPQGTFGTVTVQFTITDVNGSLYTDDLTPSSGFVVLEDGVRYKTLEIWAVLDAEPEMNETFTVTLSNPTGGARLGVSLQTFITVLENQAPLGLFRISPSINRTLDTMTVEEHMGTVFLTVSRSNGLESAVSVEWETRSGTAFGMRGEQPVLAVYQSIRDSFASVWCSVPSGDAALVLRLIKGLTQNQTVLYKWQGVFVPVEFVSIQNPKSCVGFTVNGSSYVAVSHADNTVSLTTNISLFRVQADLNLTLEQTFSVSGFSVKHFSTDLKQYLIASSEIFVWNRGSFFLHQSLELQDIIAAVPFRRGSSNVQHLAVCRNRTSAACFIYQWTDGRFQNPQPLALNTEVKQVESHQMGGDTFLFIVTEGLNPACEVFLWGSQQTVFQQTQSILVPGLFSVHPFTTPSGIFHLLLAGVNGSALYSWRSELRQFAEMLKSASAQEFLYLPVPSINSPKSLILASGKSSSLVYELTSVSNQSDFIPSSGELFFQPGVQELEIAVNVIDDDVPEEEEHFRVSLKNPKGGAEIGFRGQVTFFIPANDDTYGIIGFSQNSLMREVEELQSDNPVSLSIERRRGRFGRLTVHWSAYGSLDDIFPTSGVVTFSESQAVATISLNVLADDIPELAEKVTIVLTKVTTIGIIDPSRGASIDYQRAQANLTIRANGSPYGVIGWHLDSQYFITPEPQKSPSNITLSIVRDQGSSGNVLVYYSTKPALHLLPLNQASGGTDYVAKEATVVMMENATVVLVFLTILPDDIPELAETFFVNITRVEVLGGDTGAAQPSVKRPGLEIAEVTIQENDDPRGVLSFNVSKDVSGAVLAFEVPSPGNVLRLAVMRMAGIFGRLVLYWETQSVTASTEDFTPSSGNITFQDGQAMAYIEITIIDDTIVESTETFMVKLIRVIGGARLGVETSVVVSIPANDSPFGRFGFEELKVSVSEPQFLNDPASVATLTVVRSSGGEGVVHLIWLLQEESRDDLSPRNGTLIFNGTESKKTLVIQALADAVLEGEESFTIQLLSPKNEPVIDPVRGVATVVIRPDVGALGTVGIADSSRNVLIGEPICSYNGTALISLIRGPGIFGEIEIFWNITTAAVSEFEETSGKVVMKDRQSAATIQLKALDDEIPEERRVYQLRLSSLTPGSVINPDRQFASITMAASDLPHGLFSFSQASLRATEEDRAVNVTIVRSMGLFGSVWVSFHTEGRTAISGQDFGQSSGRPLFRPGESSRVIPLVIFDDDLPEGPEEFFLNITLVELLNASSMDFTVREYGLQIDQPPAIGNLSSLMVIIQKNDNAEGILEFDPKYVNNTVEEDVGTLSIPVLRRVGSYGQVTVQFVSKGLTAQPDSDYILLNGSITFQHGQTLSYINVSIVDDTESEFNEIFELQLTGATGGAILGAQLIARITIAKSDSPNGVVRFINQSAITIPNPNSTVRLSLFAERADGLLGDATVMWHIQGPNSNEVLPSMNTDIEPVNGTFSFRDGEGGVRSIDLKILPHGEVEVTEKFIIMLSVISGEMGVDPRAGSVTLTIEKFGDPNGIVQFTEQDLKERIYSEPSDSEGPLKVSVLVTRREGVMGNITVFWEILSDADTSGDFAALRGSVIILAGQRLAEIILTLLPDSVPELEETYTLRLTSVEGGAELDLNRSSTRLKVRANDEPHGVFVMYSQNQSVVVNAADRSRQLIISVNRLAGAFGNASVGYRISFTTPGQSFTEDTITGNILVKDGEREASIRVPVSSQVFFVTGFNFSVELTDVTLIGPLLGSPPRIQLESKLAVVSVPEVAANPVVGFASLALRVLDIESGQCEALVTRTGLYGNITVRWSSGFPPGQTPPGYQPGEILPRSGSIMLAHGQRSELISFTALNNISVVTAHAIYLTSVESESPGGARLRTGYTVAEVEPLGLYQFHPNSQHLVIEEDVQTITLYVQRFYGFRSNRSSVSYRTWPGTAQPDKDYVPVTDGQLLFDSRQTSASIRLSILDDTLTEPDEDFYVNLTSVRVLSTTLPLITAQPGIVQKNSISTVTIRANDVVSGFLSIGPAVKLISEDSVEDSPQQKLQLRVRRTAGLSGVVSAKIRAYAGLKTPLVDASQFHREHKGTWALEGEDFALETQSVTLLEGQNEVEVTVIMLNDQEPEGQEAFFIYLSDAEGGAQIVSVPDELGFTSFAKIIILGSDLQNGIVGFSLSSLSGQVLDEDSVNRTVTLVLQRQENRAFEDVLVFWRVTFSTTDHALVSHGVDLSKELLQTSGTSIRRKGEVLCALKLEVQPDKNPEYEVWFLVEVYKVGEGAAINQTARFANITMLESDDPRGLVYFAQGSRLPVVTLKATSVSLQIYRDASTASSISVEYRMQELPKVESIGPSLVWPAVAGQDFVMSEGTLTFEIGQSSAGLNIDLTPNIGSSNLTPKRFQVVLSDATGGARVHPEFGLANVTLVSDTETQAVWALLDQLHQPLEETIINRVLHALINKVSRDITPEQLMAVLDASSKILSDAEQTPLKDSSRGLTYDLLCAMANPNRTDTQGVSQLSEVAERFAYSLLTDIKCGAEGKRGITILDNCPYFTIAAHHWYPMQINGHTFIGKNTDTFTLPETLLEVPALPADSTAPSACYKVHFTEYSTEHWFLTNKKPSALNGKVFSVSLYGRGSKPLSEGQEVVYRIHTPDRRGKPKPSQSLCLLWNQAAESWLSDGQFCRLVDDTQNYVECACSHLSIYTAYAEIESLASFNEAFYAAGFICISGFALAMVSHLMCARFLMFAAKLLTHMMVACLGTQICFLVSAFRGRMFSEDSCAALGLFFHYFHLSQFGWMLVQAINFWQILVMNDEHTERRYLLYFLLSWGLPALVIIVLVVVLLGGFGWSIHSVYGLVQGDLCFIPNVYAALCTAALVPLICLVGVLVIFIHAYQVTQQWKAYDDIYRGRTNSSEVPMMLYLFALVTLVCVWAGLHMAYRYIWMLILLVIFNIFLGLYVFSVYFVMHNQLFWPGKATYTVEMNGHSSPDSIYQSTGAATVGGGEISKSTQNLISAMEEISADWERASLRPSSQPSSIFKPSPQDEAYITEGGFINTSLVRDEESQEFDDLIFALKTGSGLNVSDNESIHGSHDGGSMANSQIVELRRIPIADTHL